MSLDESASFVVAELMLAVADTEQLKRLVSDFEEREIQGLLLAVPICGCLAADRWSCGEWGILRNSSSGSQ